MCVMKKNVVSEKMVKKIMEFEGFHGKKLSSGKFAPILCQAKFWTYSYGVVCVHNGVRLRESNCKPDDARLLDFIVENIEHAECIARKKIEEFSLAVESRLHRTLLQHEFDALTCHAYNCGFSDILFLLVNTCARMDDICDWWRTHYITGSGVQLRGLIYRRYFEADLYANGW